MGDFDFDRVYGILKSETSTLETQASSVELVAEQRYTSLDTDAPTFIILPDDESEIVVTKIGWSSQSGASGKFWIHNNDGVPIGMEIGFGANAGDLIDVHLKMGRGNPCMYSSTTIGGKLSVYVEYHVESRSFRKATTTAYQDP